MIYIYKLIKTTILFTFIWIIILLQLPIIFILPKGNISVRYMKFFMYIILSIAGIKVNIHGKLSKTRPLLVVSNHISVFEIAIFSFAFNGSFFGKKDIQKWPVVGWICKKFGVIFIDRNPLKAKEVLEQVKKTMYKVNYPMFIFPEGTTTNGAYVKKFKSSLFHIFENSDIDIQPIVIHYRTKENKSINDNILAEHFAYFDNKKQDMGPFCSKERTAFGQVFHVMQLGGFNVEINIMDIPNLKGLNRKEIADKLYSIVDNKYMKLK